MKKIIRLLLVLTILFMMATTTYAVTTLFLGSTVDGKGTTNDYDNDNSYSGDISSLAMNFTNISEIKKIKTDIDYERGDFMYNNGSPSMGLWDVQVGYPLISRDKGLVYATIGGLFYNEYSDLNPKNEADSGMLGLNIIGTPIDRFQFELDIQRSIGNSTSKLYNTSGNTTHSSSEITACKVKLQYILTDNLGFAIHYRFLDIKVQELGVTAVELDSTTAGFIYRF
jgi:hypothetical protein